MAFRYLIYRTDFGNTIVRETPTDTSTGGTEQSLFSDFVIPEIQPVYLWRVSGGTDVVPNTDQNITDWSNNIAPPPDSNDVATLGDVTGYTDQKIDKVTGATGNVGTFTSDGNLEDSGYSISDLTGSTSGVTQSEFDSYTATTDTRLSNIESDISTISGDTDQNTSDIATVSAQTDTNTSDISSLSATTDSLQSQIDYVSGVTDTKLDEDIFTGYTATTQPVIDSALTGVTNLGTGTTLSSVSGRDVEIKSVSVLGNLTLVGDSNNLIISGSSGVTSVQWGDITGSLSAQTDLQNALDSKTDLDLFTGYTATTDTRLNEIESDISSLSGTTDSLQSQIDYISGVTDTKLDENTFTGYTATTQPIIDTALTGATNGLTKSGRNVLLGGALNQDTTISGTSFDFTLNVQDITLQSTGTISIIDTGGSNIDIESDGGSIDIIGNTGLGVETTKLTISETTMTITDSRGSTTGLQYAADYSTDFVTRSLVDKGYVDSVSTGLQPKAAADATTTTNIDLTGGTFGGTVDGYSVQDGDRILVKDQTAGEENGIYVYSGSSNTFYRSDDFDGSPSGEVIDGNIIPVITGNTLFNTLWVLVTPDPITVGTTSLDFTLFSSPHELIGGTGIDVVGNIISIDGVSLEGSSIVFTGNTFNVDTTTGNVATALATKLDITTFNTYTGDTDTRLNGIESDISNLSATTDSLQSQIDYVSGITDTKLDESTFTGYTATTDTRLNGIESDINYISGVTDTKLDTEIFTGYTATTAIQDERIQLVSTGVTNINTISATEIEWHEIPYSASSYSWTGGSGIFIQETGDYKITYKIGVRNGSGTAIRSVGAYIILNNNSTIVETAGAATVAGGNNISEAITLPDVILSLSANDRLDLAGFRIGNTGTVNTVSESVILLIERIS